MPEYYRGPWPSLIPRETLLEELNYYRRASEEAQAVIKQIHRGYTVPGEVVYIHPFDLSELTDDMPVSNVMHLYDGKEKLGDEITIHGIRYKQSALMPQHTTNFR